MRARRLVREAQAMARLSHPNVVPVFDAGTSGDVVFIAMKRVDGVPLGRWLEATRPDPRAIVRTMIDAGRGLGAAHAAGIIHRDFKPDNVLVDRHGAAQVGDFGLAMVDGEDATMARTTGPLPSRRRGERRPRGAIRGRPRTWRRVRRGERAELARPVRFAVTLTRPSRARAGRRRRRRCRAGSIGWSAAPRRDPAARYPSRARSLTPSSRPGAGHHAVAAAAWSGPLVAAALGGQRSAAAATTPPQPAGQVCPWLAPPSMPRSPASHRDRAAPPLSPRPSRRSPLLGLRRGPPPATGARRASDELLDLRMPASKAPHEATWCQVLRRARRAQVDARSRLPTCWRPARAWTLGLRGRARSRDAALLERAARAARLAGPAPPLPFGASKRPSEIAEACWASRAAALPFSRARRC